MPETDTRSRSSTSSPHKWQSCTPTRSKPLAELEHLEVAEARMVDVDRLVLEVLDCMRTFEKVASQGTVEEKRVFLRTFIRRVEPDPKTGKGRLEFYRLPGIQASQPSRDA